jgi:hypothetical protein
VVHELSDRRSFLNGWMAALAWLAMLSAACSEGAAPSGSDGESADHDGSHGGQVDAGSDGNSVNPGGDEEDAARDGGATDHDDTGGSDDGRLDAGLGGTGGGPDPATILFAEDFEATATDAVPAGFSSFVAYEVDRNNEKGRAAYALVDDTKPRSGKHALHVKSDGQPAMITRALPEDTHALFVRVWVHLTGSLGQAPGRNHETLLGVRKSVGGAHDEVRFGEIKGVIGVNEVPSDNISPKMDLWGKGPSIAGGDWHCIEVAFRADLPQHEVRAFRDGVEIFSVNDPSQWQNGPLSPTFLDGKFVEFILGWQSFSNYANEIWFDDLVVATERVGCGAAP